jgi:hypothetical protein
MDHKQKLAAAARRELAILERSETVIRGADGKPTGLTPNGLKLVEILATAGGSKNYVAAKLGIPQATFKKLLGAANDETDARMSFERGHALHEHDVATRLLAADAPAASLVFYAKSRLGWKDEPPVPSSTNNVVISLPGAMTSEQYYKMLGIDGPVDSRQLPARNITPTEDKALYESNHQQGSQ